MKKTPLTDSHISLNAKMGEFAGYNMPLYYDLGEALAAMYQYYEDEIEELSDE